MKNYYAILGVHHTASSGEIKRAYRRLAVSLHPDKNPDPEAEQLFKEVNEAYEVIGDPEKRKTYDNWLDYPSEAPKVETRRSHRDPAYRRRRSTGRQTHGKPTTRDLMAEYIDYFKWATYAGFVLSALLAIDYVLPDRTIDDRINGIYTVSKSTARYGRSMVYAYDIIETKNGKSIRVYDHKADHFEVEDSVRVFSTIIFSEPMRIHSLENSHVTDLGYLYHTGAGLVPLALFILTGLAVILRHRIEFLFNASIVSIVLIVIVLYLIFTI